MIPILFLLLVTTTAAPDASTFVGPPKGTPITGVLLELLARGYTQEQILDYFERSYGQFVLLNPKFEGVNALVWLLPVMALIAGVLMVISKTRKLEKPANHQDPYLAQVRNLVNGGKP